MIKSEIFKNLLYQTQLLESLSWDEEQLQALYEYLEIVFNADIVVHPNEILATIKECFGEDTYKCFKNIFNEVMVLNNMHLRENLDEHWFEIFT